MAQEKKRNWAFLVYPGESAPDDWEQILIDTGLPCAISPYHDKDVNPTGEIKKAHRHVIVCYPGPTTFQNVERLAVQKLHGTIPIPLESVKGMYRYHCHLDNPEKWQYPQSGRIHLNGFDVAAYADRTKQEIFRAVVEITKIIQQNGFAEYADLIDFLFLKMMQDEAEEKYAFFFEVASTHTLYFRSYLVSRKKRDFNRQNDERPPI